MGLFVLVEPGPKRRGASFLAKGDGNLCSVSLQSGGEGRCSVGRCGCRMLVHICLFCAAGKPLTMLPGRN